MMSREGQAMLRCAGFPPEADTGSGTVQRRKRSSSTGFNSALRGRDWHFELTLRNSLVNDHA